MKRKGGCQDETKKELRQGVQGTGGKVGENEGNESSGSGAGDTRGKYISDLDISRQKKIITEEITDEIVKGSEAKITKISKGLFRYAVEVGIIIMILSEQANVPPKVMEEYRKESEAFPT